jgi:cell wall-associated NlpC family hydrolase
MNQNFKLLAYIFPLCIFNSIYLNYSLSNSYTSSNLHFFNPNNQLTFHKYDESSAEAYNENSELRPNILVEKRDSLVNFAKKFLGTPYWWGGTTPKGFDCSGFAQYVYKNFGFDLPRVSGAQAQLGLSVKLEEAQTGDLVYYGYPSGNSWVFTHTAIVYANDAKGIRVIHSYYAGVGITGLYFDPNWRVICIKRMI